MAAKRPDHAMALAAGFGTRLKPLTDRIPKPLIEVAGRTLLDHMLDRFAAFAIENVVVNTHYLADKVQAHLAGRRHPKIAISHEPDILETGGGVANALPKLGSAAFFVGNTDVLILNGVRPALDRMAAAWDPAIMDALLLIHPTVRAYGYDGQGDFVVDANGLVRRRREREVAPYLFAGVQILKPGLFDDHPTGRFSLNVIYDKALLADRLYGLVHDGAWLHIGTARALDGVDRYLKHEVI